MYKNYVYEIFMYILIIMNLAPIIIEAEKSHDQQLGSWRPRCFPVKKPHRGAQGTLSPWTHQDPLARPELGAKDLEERFFQNLEANMF